MNDLTSETNTSLTEVDGNIIVTLSREMNVSEIESLKESVAKRAYKRNVSGAIFDFSTGTIVDSFIYDSLTAMSRTLRLMGVKVVWTGLNPGTVAALMDLNVDLDTTSIKTAINLEQGLKLLKQV